MRKTGLNHIRDISLVGLILAASTMTGVFFQKCELHETNVVVVYLFSVLLISRFTQGYIYGIMGSIVSILLFNWFFTEPYFTLKVHDMTYLITFFIMMVTSVVTSTLTTKVKKSASDAKEREKESNALYQMTNQLTDAEDVEAIARIMVITTSEILKCNTACICFDEKEIAEKTFFQNTDDGRVIRRELIRKGEVYRRLEQCCKSLEDAPINGGYPVQGKGTLLALLLVPQNVVKKMTAAQTRMIHSIIESAALALERLRSLQEQARSREETMQERYRGNLLRAISHDIRTPLSGIMGTSEMLMDALESEDERHTLAKNIHQDAQWLHAMVENILNLTRLQDGKLVLNKQPEAVEEVIGVALLAMDKRLARRFIHVEMPENVVMVPMDAKLISQVLINLLDNADKHTPEEREISIHVQEDEKNVSITVADRGKGILKNDLPHIFQMFYTTCSRGPDSKRGVGLGLAICQSIIEAHGGTIGAENRRDGGAAFTFTLPVGGE